MKAEKFLELVQRSKLIENDQLARFVSAFKKKATPEQLEDASSLAEDMIAEGLLTRWQSDRILEGRYNGFFLSKYKLLGHLGTGGMSSVYLAEHVLMQRRVAIKLLPKARVNDSSYLARFHQEAQVVAKLDHPNIVKAYDIDHEGNNHFIVMEYVDGSDLQRMVKTGGPLDTNLAAEYIRQAAEGLQHAHSAGLVHRDIKPANLLVNSRGVVKVLDMGLAKFTEPEKASLTLAFDENVLGTADYLAPEQARDSHHVDRRADIYSLGCTLYFVLTGHPPFPEGTLVQRAMKHQTEKPVSIIEERPKVAVDLVEICDIMMAKDPDDRYQNAREIAEALYQFLADRGAAPNLGPSGDSSLKPGTRYPGMPPGDTVSDLARETMKGGGSKSPGSRTSDSAKPTKLRRATPIEEEDPALVGLSSKKLSTGPISAKNASGSSKQKTTPPSPKPSPASLTPHEPLPPQINWPSAAEFESQDPDLFLSERLNSGQGGIPPQVVWAIGGILALAIACFVIYLILNHA